MDKPIFPMTGPAFEDPPKKENQRIKVYLDPEVMEDLCRAAEKMGITPNALMADIIKKAVDSND